MSPTVTITGQIGVSTGWFNDIHDRFKFRNYLNDYFALDFNSTIYSGFSEGDFVKLNSDTTFSKVTGNTSSDIDTIFGIVSSVNTPTDGNMRVRPLGKVIDGLLLSGIGNIGDTLYFDPAQTYNLTASKPAGTSYGVYIKLSNTSAVLLPKSSGSGGGSGSAGTSGTSGTSGSDGTSGTSGVDGVSGTSGTSGIDGTSGSSGISGVDGTDGSSGTSGVDGVSGTSGTSGSSGISGSDGTSGSSGDSLFAQTGSFWATTNDIQITGSLDITSQLGITDSNTIMTDSASLYLTSGSNLYILNGQADLTNSDLTINTGDLTVNNGTISGSFVGDGAGLYNIPSSGITGLQLDRIVSGSVSASLEDGILKVNTDVVIDGTITAKQLDITYVSSSVLYQSGSTKFGNTQDDTHQITGSVYTTGSITIDGDLIVNGTTILRTTDPLRDSLIISGALAIVQAQIQAQIISASISMGGQVVISEQQNINVMDLGGF